MARDRLEFNDPPRPEDEDNDDFSSDNGNDSPNGDIPGDGTDGANDDSSVGGFVPPPGTYDENSGIRFNISSAYQGGLGGTKQTAFVKRGNNSFTKIENKSTPLTFTLTETELSTPHTFKVNAGSGYATDRYKVSLKAQETTLQARDERGNREYVYDEDDYNNLLNQGWRPLNAGRDGTIKFVKPYLLIEAAVEVRSNVNNSNKFKRYKTVDLPTSDVIKLPIAIYKDDNDGGDDDFDDDEVFDIDINFDTDSSSQNVIGYEIINAKITSGEDGEPTGKISLKVNNKSQIRLYPTGNASKYNATWRLTNVGIGTGFSNSVSSGDYKRVKTILPKTFDLGSKDVNVRLRSKKVESGDDDDNDDPNPPPKTNIPVLDITSNRNSEFNIQDKTLKIGYRTKYADSVYFSLGGREKQIKPNSSPIILTESDFPKGLGTYKLALRPYSNKGGYGTTKYATIKVVNEYNVPEPDITVIRFPEVIDGEDFQGFDIDFDVNYKSVNTTYVNVYIDSTDKNSLIAKKNSATGKVRLNVAKILRKSRKVYNNNLDVVNFDLYLIPYNSYGDNGRTEKISIKFKQGLRLTRESVVASIREAFERRLDTGIFDEATSEFLTHNIHLGRGNNKLISTWAIDTETFSEFEVDSDTGLEYKTKENKTLVLKLYEPLPDEVGENDKIWISKIQSIPIIEQVTMVGTDTPAKCVNLEPNFNLDFGEAVGYEILDELVASGSTTSNELVNTFVSKSEFSLDDLHFNYVSASDVNWGEFVKYSSAEERVNNFFYKVKVIENYENKYSASLSTPSGSIQVNLEKKSSLAKRNELVNSFDKFEKFLFESSSANQITYPKENDTGSYLSTTSSAADQWYNASINSAREYDKNNYNALVNNLPKHIVTDQNGQEFVLFFNMVGQHFDNIYSYIEGINKNRVVEHKIDKGINDRMIYHMLQSLGWNANYGVEGQVLWEYAFGVDRDGSNKQRMTGKERQEEVWRRILNNLPYLLKYKGTKNSLSAILSIYGIPNSLLTILEFGGPTDVDESGTRNFTFEDRTSALNLDGTGSLIIPWNSYSSSLSEDYPLGIEMRVYTQNQTRQTLIENEGNWYLDVIPNTGSMATFEFGILSGSSYISSSTIAMPFYNDEFTQVVINKNNFSSGSTFEIIAKEGFQERIRSEVSTTLTTELTSSWDSGSELLIGNSSRGTFTGQIDEFRLWRIPLDELSIENHTLMPEAIDGQSYSSSIDDLLLRNDFEYPNNLGTSGSVIPSGSVKNVSINRNYGVNYISASNFTGISTYPYNYTVYDRTVTANVPSTGIMYNNKFRFEDSYTLRGQKITDNLGVDLSVKLRKTKREYDQSNIDQNKLGLLFSPTKEINMDILKSLGAFNLDDYIGSPDDRYSYRYRELDEFRNYYFDRFDLNLYEYINIVRLIEKTLFDTLESLVPARAKVAKGLLIEPHILERSKVEWKRAEADRNNYGAKVDTREFILTSSSLNNYNGDLDASSQPTLYVNQNNYESILDAEPEINVISEINDYDTAISYSEQYSLESTIVRNSGSTMAGMEVEIDAEFTGSLEGEYVNRSLTQVGNGTLSQLGFGLYGENGDSIRTWYDIFGNYNRERSKVFKIKTERLVLTPVEVSGSIEYQKLPEYETKITILPFTGSDGNESTDVTVGGDIVEVTPLNGYFQTHYKFVGDLTTGLKRSYHDGSKQTSETTLDGSAPVETFITNPNELRVTDSGRGSGEPILIVPGDDRN